MNRVIIGVASNLDPSRHIWKAREAILQNHRLIEISRFQETEAMGDPNQPPYTNGVFLIETDWNQERLKSWLKKIEDELGRTRDTAKSPLVTIDLDILTWNEKIIDPEVCLRKFLQESILEVCPEMTDAIHSCASQ